jgi:hypothetical protein
MKLYASLNFQNDIKLWRDEMDKLLLAICRNFDFDYEDILVLYIKNTP